MRRTKRLTQEQGTKGELLLGLKFKSGLDPTERSKGPYIHEEAQPRTKRGTMGGVKATQETMEKQEGLLRTMRRKDKRRNPTIRKTTTQTESESKDNT